MKHTCHALGCTNGCPPAYLMCGPCWARVPGSLQREVYRTVRLRDMGAIDKTWAPWWRAQARAIARVAEKHEAATPVGDTATTIQYASVGWNTDLYLRRELAFADELEKK